ncbi:leucyl/phenylalanyl-tRNA--protein transferase [Eisenibacter elegans]|jgi:leucyl/phenylalanyl-tRNA--protein transferase|uniref:leucyl/phenylalanyl-tRNA--protein transferase n=1 Tax=Eisenibacter elegans TaxID=997 RepID=UPI00041AE5AB|nr:leucyl/phenylalanyl-tRNA--protein transferase [Eisenibacter elegans]
MYYFLDQNLYFPPVELADEDGILALGGDLSQERLLLAYRSGIFPWYSQGDPIIWWSPNPRFVLYPKNLKVSKSMRTILRQGRFRVSFDQAFEQVIGACRHIPRSGQYGTWITDEMLQAYLDLHHQGYAHSVEVWQDEQLVGGLYGVSMGRVFFGESMFSKVSNASKAGFLTLTQKLAQLDFQLIDCQVHTTHLESLGAIHIPRTTFVQQLHHLLRIPTWRGNWQSLEQVGIDY